MVNFLLHKLAAQGRKTMFALKSTMKQLYLNHCTLRSLFDTYVCTILNYGCEVWGSHRGPVFEKIHLEFLRYVWEFVKIQIHLWYILRQGACLCILLVFFECSNFGLR